MDLISATAQPYRVLARTYRPQRLSELIGQEALVRTLTNAMASGRIAHAFLLAGIRGIGKTTTARIIAKGLNCTGPDGHGRPTPEPCGVCPSCKALIEERPIDVIEMDAATRTGIDDIREIVDAVRYAPAASRYKIYIIDEVHMLSEKAFNGLLKTLEEPPPHAKFIFATTEVRKLPVTVLSRCQRFDLKRVEPEVLKAHLARIAEREGVAVEAEALTLIARTAEGSVRDALSLLDQAIALADGPVQADVVSGMLGLGDRERLVDLFAAVAGGRAGEALDGFRELFRLGAEPAAVLQDLLEISHWLSCLIVDRDAASAFAATPEATARGQSLAESVGLAPLARAWQVLLKGLDETRSAPDAAAAAEMVLLRLAAMGSLPTPGEVIRRLERQGDGATDPSSGTAAGSAAEPLPGRHQPPTRPPAPPPMARTAPLEPRPAPGRAPGPSARQTDPAIHEPADFADLVRRLQRAEPLLAAFLKQGAHLVSFQRDRIELRLEDGLPANLSGRLSEALLGLTGRRWLIALSQSPGRPTLAEQEAAERRRQIEAVANDAAIREVLEAFPGATIVDIREARAGAGRSPDAGLDVGPEAGPDGAAALHDDDDDADDHADDDTNSDSLMER